MENLIKYYYDIENVDIFKTDEYFYFKLNSYYYYFMPCKRSLNELKDIEEISNKLIQKNLLVHKLILNNKNELLCEYKNEPYILIKTYINKQSAFDIHDILYLNNTLDASSYKSSKISRQDWEMLWQAKIDYFEYQFMQLEKKYPIIRSSFSYYIGLAENAISYIKQFKMMNDKKTSNLVICRRKIKSSATAFDIYNPLNLVVDVKMRDIAEYLKYCFINNINWRIEFNMLLNNQYINEVDAYLLYSRLLYPSFYFEVYERVIYGINEETELLDIVKRNKEYEEFLKIIYFELNKLFKLPKINWL